MSDEAITTVLPRVAPSQFPGSTFAGKGNMQIAAFFTGSSPNDRRYASKISFVKSATFWSVKLHFPRMATSIKLSPTDKVCFLASFEINTATFPAFLVLNDVSGSTDHPFG